MVIFQPPEFPLLFFERFIRVSFRHDLNTGCELQRKFAFLMIDQFNKTGIPSFCGNIHFDFINSI